MILTMIGIAAVLLLALWAGLMLMDGRLRVLCLSLLTLAVLSSAAEACPRCGLFGRRCRFAAPQVVVAAKPVVHAPVYTPPVYHSPVVQLPVHHDYAPKVIEKVVEVATPTQNFIFNNAYPVAALTAPAGLLPASNSVYGQPLYGGANGFSLAAVPLQLDVAGILDRSARLSEVLANGAARALSEHNGNIQGALSLVSESGRQASNTAIAVAALQANGATGGPQTIKATVQGGRVDIQQLNTKPCPCDADVPPPAPIGLTSCTRCHDGKGTNNTPVDFVIQPGVALTVEQYTRAAKAVMSGKMPPQSSLTLEQRTSLAAELAKLAN